MVGANLPDRVLSWPAAPGGEVLDKAHRRAWFWLWLRAENRLVLGVCRVSEPFLWFVVFCRCL